MVTHSSIVHFIFDSSNFSRKNSFASKISRGYNISIDSHFVEIFFLIKSFIAYVILYSFVPCIFVYWLIIKIISIYLKITVVCLSDFDRNASNPAIMASKCIFASFFHK
jgi:hypothetical protein